MVDLCSKARWFRRFPVAPIAAARTPTRLVQALADTVVPAEENGLPFLAALRAAGGVC